MADWIWMPFVVVSGVDRGIGVLNGGRYRRRGRGSFGGKCHVEYPIVTNRDYMV